MDDGELDYGVLGRSDKKQRCAGESISSNGVYGESDKLYGVFGISIKSIGVRV
jgi:hypothetical protein